MICVFPLAAEVPDESDVLSQLANLEAPRVQRLNSQWAQASVAAVEPPAVSGSKLKKYIPKKYDVGLIGDRGIGKGMNLYSIEKEEAIGREMSQELETHARILKDPVINEYVNRLGQNLVRNSDAVVPFTIKVVQDDEINALALPGGCSCLRGRNTWWIRASSRA